MRSILPPSIWLADSGLRDERTDADPKEIMLDEMSVGLAPTRTSTEPRRDAELLEASYLVKDKQPTTTAK